MKDILTVKEAANFLKKHPDTIRHWINMKKLPARKLSAGKNGFFVLLRNDILETMVADMVKKKEQEKSKKKVTIKPSNQVELPI